MIPSSLIKKSILFCISCIPVCSAQSADLSRLVVVGDSLSAGVQNISLLDTQQQHGYAPLIAKQAGVPMVLPLIRYPGLPNVLQIGGFDPLPVLQPAPVAPPFPPRDFPNVQPTNLGVPGTTLAGALVPPAALPDPVRSWEKAVLQSAEYSHTPLSQVEEAIALKPTSIILWLGNNDALLPALTGGAIPLTPVPAFKFYFGMVLGPLAKTGATMIVANIPDVTEIAFFTPVSRIADWAGETPAAVAAALGTGPGDYLRLSALKPALQILTGSAPGPLPTTCDVPYAGFPPVPAIPCVLTAADAAVVRAQVAAYNAVIAAAVAATPNAILVDIRSLFDQITANGYNVPGRDLDTGYFGGLFSLDGIHPTNTAYALIANQFIETMNVKLHTGIKNVDVAKVAKDDPLVLNKGQRSHLPF
jgi:hypothetical protein